MPRLQAGDGLVRTVNGKQTILYPIDAAASNDLTERIRTIALRRELPNESIDSNGNIVQNIGNSVKIRPTNVTAVLYIEYTGGVDGDGNRVPDDYDEIILLQNGPKGGFSQLPALLDTQTDDFPNGHTTRRLLVNGVIESVQANRTA